jgi:alpha-1,2-mannosyltransferase
MRNVSVSGQGNYHHVGSFTFRAGVLCLLGFATLNAWMIWQVHDSILQGYVDFASFYTAGKIVQRGQSPRLYDPALQWKVQQEFASTVKIRSGPLPYIRPPFEALLFLPLAYLTYPTACVVWMALKTILLFAIPFLLPREDRNGEAISVHVLEGLLCLAFFPAAFDLLQGQDSILLLLIMVFALRLLLRGADLQCGVLLGLGLFKFHLILPLIAIFVLRKRSRIVTGFLAMASLLFVISLVLVHRAGILAYPRYLLGLNQMTELGMVKPQSMPNVRGLVTLFLGNGRLPAAAQWFLGAVVIIGVIVAARFWRDDKRRSIVAAFCFSIVVILATSYYSYSYDMTLLLLPLFLLNKDFLLGSEIAGWPRTLFIAAVAVLLFTPFSWILAIRLGQFRLMGLVLLALAVSVSALLKSSEVVVANSDSQAY